MAGSNHQTKGIMKKFALLIEEEWSAGKRSRTLKSRTVLQGTIESPNLIALLREELAFRYFGGRAPNMARLDYLDFDPKIDRELRLPAVSRTWCKFSFVPPNDKNRCVSVEARVLTNRRHKPKATTETKLEEVKRHLDLYAETETEDYFDHARTLLAEVIDHESRVFIVVEGGVVQDVLADDETIACYLIDHDNGDADEKVKAENAALEKQCETLGSLTLQ